MEQVLDLPQRLRKPDIHHDSKADDLGRSLEITEWISHPQTLQNAPLCLKQFYSDSANGSNNRVISSV